MQDDAHRYVYQAVYNHDIGPVTHDVRHRIEQWAEKILGVPNGGEKARRDARNEARQFADAIRAAGGAVTWSGGRRR